MQEDIVVVSDDSALGSDTAKELAQLKTSKGEVALGTGVGIAGKVYV